MTNQSTELIDNKTEDESEFKSFAAEVWDTLSNIDCRAHVKEKGDFTYLSWVWAWGLLMEHYPESAYEVPPPINYPNETVEIRVVVIVKKGNQSLSRFMWLPVMNYKNQSIVAPGSREISDTRMRCFTKCIAMFGLGHHIYAGEDIPREEDAKPIHRFKTGEKEQIIVQVLKCLERNDKEGVQEILEEYGDDPEIKNKVWYLFESSVRAQLKILLKDE